MSSGLNEMGNWVIPPCQLTPMSVGQITGVSCVKVVWQHFRGNVYDDSNKQMMKRTRTLPLTQHRWCHLGHLQKHKLSYPTAYLLTQNP